MDFGCKRLSGTIASLGLLALFAFGALPSQQLFGSPASPPQTAQQEFSSCVSMAQSGQVVAAFDKVKNLRSQFEHQRMFEVNYINTLMGIVESGTSVSSSQKVAIVNEAIRMVNEARTTGAYNGNGDPEIAYHFMNTLGRLSQNTEEISDVITTHVQIYEGQIATNLRDNMAYPRNAIEALSGPMINMAKAYSGKDDSTQVYQAILSAVRCGYGDYAKLADEKWLTDTVSQTELTTWMNTFEHEYQTAVTNWTEMVLREFAGGSFQFNLQDLTGRSISQYDFRGQIAVIDLWATWCPPCRRGIPHYQELATKYNNKGVAVVGISMDKPENPSEAKQTVVDFVEAQKITYPILMGDTSIDSQLPGKKALPTTVFLDRTGRVRYIARGYHDITKIEALTNYLRNESQPVNSGSPGVNY